MSIYDQFIYIFREDEYSWFIILSKSLNLILLSCACIQLMRRMYGMDDVGILSQPFFAFYWCVVTAFIPYSYWLANGINDRKFNFIFL